MEIERIIWEIAERQHGVVARRQLLEHGFTERQVRVVLGRGAPRS
jgi:hypothetical protein